MTPTKISVRTAAKDGQSFLNQWFPMKMADEHLLMRLALAWSVGIARCYPEKRALDVLGALSAADWSGLALIECAFAQLSRDYSIDPDEHERGVALFLQFALSCWEDILDEDEPRLYIIAEMFVGILESWLNDSECVVGCCV